MAFWVENRCDTSVYCWPRPGSARLRSRAGQDWRSAEVVVAAVTLAVSAPGLLAGAWQWRFRRFDRDDRFFFRRGLFANGSPFWGWGGGWGYPYGDNAYSGYNYPGSDYSGLSGSASPPFVIGASAPTGQPGNYCIISVKACQLHDPPFVGNDCSCKVQGGDTSEVP